jgi:hypothetical protein
MKKMLFLSLALMLCLGIANARDGTCKNKPSMSSLEPITSTISTKGWSSTISTSDVLQATTIRLVDAEVGANVADKINVYIGKHQKELEHHCRELRSIASDANRLLNINYLNILSEKDPIPIIQLYRKSRDGF